MTSSLSRAVVAVEAARLTGEAQDRAQSISDLFAWCGDGVLTPNQLHAYLRPDPSLARPRAAALLLRAPSGRHYLATACRVLSDEAVAGAALQDSLEPDRGAFDEAGPSEPEVPGQPVRGVTELSFDDPLLNAAHGRGLFPAASFPHLDLSLIWLDQADPALRYALESAGFEFAEFDAIAEGPSRDGAEISVITSVSGSPDDARLTGAGRATGLSQNLSFFWTDAALPPSSGGTPVIEDGRVVGFYSPQHADVPARLPSSFALVTKADSLKALLAAQEAQD